MDKQQLIHKLLEIVKLHSHEAQQHEHYQRTVDLAVLYSQIISGKDIDDLLKQFVRREDDIMFEQRVNLTQQTTPSIANGIIKTFNKVYRTKPAVEAIDFEKDSSDEKIREVKDALSKIYGKKDIYKYIQDRFSYLSFCDPNAFIYTTFKAFEAKKEKPKPYNMEISSKAAINYEYFNNELQWLVSKVDHAYLEEDKDRDGFIYTIYGPLWAMVMTQVGKDYNAESGEDVITVELDNKHVEYYIYEEHEHKSDIIPVIQVGYERDLQTEGATFVSPIEAGMPYFMKLIKTVSEFDLTNCLHVFPKLFQYFDPCKFNAEGKCNDSGLQKDRCTKCNKTGRPLHTSAQDAILVPIPKDPNDLMDLSKMIHVETPAVDLLEFQKKLIDDYGHQVRVSVFNANALMKEGVETFATGLMIDEQNVYDTLKPYAEKISDVYVQIASVTGHYLDYHDIIVDHQYPEDFKFKTTDQLIEELKKAKDSGASGYIIRCIEDDIMRQKYIDQPLKFQNYEVKQRFYPFNGKTDEQIQQIILGGKLREKDIVLYNYFEDIFTMLEEEYLNQSPAIWFYDLTYEKQREAIDRKVDEIMAEINEDKAFELSMAEETEPVS
jgi:hypothetical protein